MKILEELFLPNYFVKQFNSITPESLKRLGYRAVLIDLDNTLVAFDEADANEVVIQWFEELEASDIKVIIVSNGKRDRVSKFADRNSFLYIDSAKKPLSKNFIKALKQLNVLPTEAVMIGDQLLTDVLGSRRVGIDSILVIPIKDKDLIQTKVNRAIESVIMNIFKKRGLVNWRQSIE